MLGVETAGVAAMVSGVLADASAVTVLLWLAWSLSAPVFALPSGQRESLAGLPQALVRDVAGVQE